MKSQFYSFLLLFIGTSLFTAEALQSQTSVGLRGGLNISKWDWSDAEYNDVTKNSTNFVFGIPVRIGLGGGLSLQTGIDYIRKGVTLEEEDLGISGKSVISLNYIEIPAMLQFGFDLGGVGIGLQAGPSLGYGLDGKVDSEFTIAGQTEKESEEIDWDEDEIARTDFGLNLGAFLGFEMTTVNLFLDARYQLGLTDLNDSDDGEEAKNRGIQISLGFLYPIN